MNITAFQFCYEGWLNYRYIMADVNLYFTVMGIVVMTLRSLRFVALNGTATVIDWRHGMSLKTRCMTSSHWYHQI